MRFCLNLKQNIFICLPIIIEIKIYKCGSPYPSPLKNSLFIVWIGWYLKQNILISLPYLRRDSGDHSPRPSWRAHHSLTGPISSSRQRAPGPLMQDSPVAHSAGADIRPRFFCSSWGWGFRSNCFNGLLRALTKNSLEDRMSKFLLVKKWWDFENRVFWV